MQKRIILLVLVILLSGAFAWTVSIRNKSPENVNVATTVLGLSDSPLYIPNDYKSLGSPDTILPLSDGSYWYYDMMNYNLVKVSSAGSITRRIGRIGKDAQGYESRVRLTIDNEGNLYAASSCQVIKLDSNGGEIDRWDICGSVPGRIYWSASSIAFNPENNRIYMSFYDGGSSTIGNADPGSVRIYSTDGEYISSITMPGQLETVIDAYNQQRDLSYRPMFMAVGATGKVYVQSELLEITTEFNNGYDSELPHCRIQVFLPNGDFDFDFRKSRNDCGTPNGMTVLPNGKILLSSQYAPFVQVYNADGTANSTWGEYGTNAWQFLTPEYIASDTAGNVWISDMSLYSIQKFSSSGVFISALRNNGTVDGRLTAPSDMDFDSSGNAYVLDNIAIDPRVQKFTNDGTYLSTIVPLSSTSIAIEAYCLKIHNDKIYISDKEKVTVFDLSGNVLDTFGSSGTGVGQFAFPKGIDFDSLGNIYVVDTYNHRIQKYDADGNYLTSWGSSGVENNQLMFPSAIYIDSQDNVFIGESAESPEDQNLGLVGTEVDYKEVFGVDETHARIKVFDTAGAFIRKFDVGSHDNGSTPDIIDIALDRNGKLNLTTSDYVNGKEIFVSIYDTDGTNESSYGSFGSGIEQFVTSGGIALNPLTNFMTVVDTYNNRIQMLPAGTKIYNLTSSADVVKANESTSLVSNYFNPGEPGVNNISSSLYFGPYVVSDFSVNLTQKRDWVNVAVSTLPSESKSFVANLNPEGAPGISNTHSLYIAKHAGQNRVRVCPTATQMEEVTSNCVGGYVLNEGAAALSTVTLGGDSYWKVSGLTGTGVMALSATPTASLTATPNATITSTPTPKVTVKTTPRVTIKPTSVTRIPVVTLPAAVIGVASPACPVFDSFGASTTILKKGDKVKFTWSTTNTESVKNSYSLDTLPPIGEFEIAPDKTVDMLFTADNGYCSAKKSVLVQVVDTLPWNNTVAVGSGLLLVEATLALQQPMIFGNLWLGIFSFFDRKKKRSWGFIYDALSKKPISRAVIRLLNSDGVVVDTVVSEANGTYKLVSKIGEFTVQVLHPLYDFPSKTITGTTDQGYSNIYLGGKIKINSVTDSILLSIPMDAKQLSEDEKRSIRFKNGLVDFWSYLTILLVFLGFVYSLYIAYVYPHIINYSIVGAYLFFILIKLLGALKKSSNFGRVSGTNGLPLQGVELGLYDAEFNNLLYRTFTSTEGEYSFVVPNAKYVLRVLDNRYTLYLKKEQLEKLEIPALRDQNEVRIIKENLTLMQNS